MHIRQPLVFNKAMESLIFTLMCIICNACIPNLFSIFGSSLLLIKIQQFWFQVTITSLCQQLKALQKHAT